jgi:hypothetical protein
LSPKQRYVFDEKVGPLLEERGEENYWAARVASAPP